MKIVTLTELFDLAMKNKESRQNFSNGISSKVYIITAYRELTGSSLAQALTWFEGIKIYV